MSALINPFWFAAAGATDPYFANVVLLCHFEGADATTNCVDSSAAAHTVTGGSTATISTAQAKFGGSSLRNTGNGSATSPDSADWNLGAGQFTIEAWVRPTNAFGAADSTIVCQWGTAANHGWRFFFNSTGIAFGHSMTGSDQPAAINGAYVATLNVWMHVAVDRDASNVLRLYVDGVVKASATVSATFFNSTLTLLIANNAGVLRPFLGYIDDLRITKNVARYAGAFTPPSAAYPDA